MSRRLAAVPDAARRAGLYVRVSAVMGRTGEDFLSPTVQVDTMTAAAARAGDRVVEAWEDLDVSGRSMVRPGLERALAAARDGRIDRLYVYDLSRWARNAADGLAELAAIERLGVEVVSATESVDRSTSSGRLTAGMLLLLAEHYSDLVGERWRGVIAANAERGVYHASRPPHGYARVGRREIAPDPVLGPVWAEAFRRYAEGEGLAGVARYVTAARGKPTEASEVARVLRSRAYLGEVRHGDRWLPGRHAPLVDVETWQRAQERLEANARTPSRTKAAAHALAGLVRCGRCGAAAYKRTKPGREPALVCRRAYLDPGSCEGIGWPRLPPIERAALEAVAARVSTLADTSAAEAAAAAARQARAVADARSIADEIGRTEAALGVLAAKLGTGVLSDAAYRAGAAALEETLERLRAQAREVAETQAAPSFAAAASLGEALLDLWPRMTDRERNEALRVLVREVRIMPPARRHGQGPREVRLVWTDGVES